MADLDFLGESFHKHALFLGYEEMKNRISAFVRTATKFPEFVYKRVKNMAHKEMALHKGIVQFAPLFYYQRDEHSQARKDTTEGWVGFEPFFLWIPAAYANWIKEWHNVNIFPPDDFKQSQSGLYLLDEERVKYVGKIRMIKVSITEILFSPLSIFCCSTEKNVPYNLKRDFGQYVYKIHVENFLNNLTPITPVDRSLIYTSVRTGEKLSMDRLLPIIDACKVSYLKDGIHGESIQHRHSMFLARVAHECCAIFCSIEMLEAIRVANPNFSLVSAFKANLEKTINANARAWVCGAPRSAFLKREQFVAQKEFRFSISFVDRNSKVYIRYPTEKTLGSRLIPGGIMPPPNPFLLRIRNPEEVFFDV